MEREQAVDGLYWWQFGSDCFDAMLFSLIQKADTMNLHRLHSAFPMHVNVYLEWQRYESNNGFFDKEGLFEKNPDYKRFLT